MHGVAFLIAAAAVALLLARRLKLPPSPVLILVGVGLGLAAPMPAAAVEDALVLGATFLLFLAGLELDPRRMRAQTRAAVQVGSVHFVVLAAASFVAARVMGFTSAEASYVALALAASSTLVGVRLLKSRKQTYEPFGRLVLGVLLLQDLLVLASIPLLGGIGDPHAAVTGLIGVTAMGGAAVMVRLWLTSHLLKIADDAELVLLTTLGLLFAFLALGSWIGLPTVVGAFFAGVSLASFPVNGIVRVEMAPVGDFFMAIFFTALGAIVRIPSATETVQALLLGALVILITIPLVTVLAERAGFPAKSAIETGLLLSQTSEISLVIGLAGMLQGDLNQGTFTVITLLTVGTMLLTPILATDRVAWWLMRGNPARRRLQNEEIPTGHVLLLGAGSTGMPVLETLVIAGVEAVVVDDDPAVLAGLRDSGIRTLRGDGADRVVLRRAGADRARVVISTLRRARDNGALLEIARGVPTLVRVFEAADAHWVRERGGIPVLYSEATADALMEWFDDVEEDLRSLAAVRAGDVPVSA